MALVFIIAFILLILLVPIPIKFSLTYQQNNLDIYFYFKKLNLKKVKNKKNKNEHKKKSKYHISLSLIKNIFFKLSNIRYKPIVKLDFSLEFGFNDAALTAISYGVFSTFKGFMLETLSLIFNFKKTEFNIIPQFNSKVINLKFNCIILLNLAKVIYILLIIKSIINENKI